MRVAETGRESPDLSSPGSKKEDASETSLPLKEDEDSGSSPVATEEPAVKRKHEVLYKLLPEGQEPKSQCRKVVLDRDWLPKPKSSNFDPTKFYLADPSEQ